MSDPWEDAVKEPVVIPQARPPPPVLPVVPQGPGPKPDAPPGKVAVLVNNKWFVVTPPPADTAAPATASGGGVAVSSKTLVNMAKLHSASAHEKGADGIRDAKSDAIATLLYEDAKLAKERAIRERMRKFNGR